MFLRVASAETDDQLEKAVGNFLCPVLLKVGSPHQEVKNKVHDKASAMMLTCFSVFGRICVFFDDSIYMQVDHIFDQSLNVYILLNYSVNCEMVCDFAEEYR